MTYANFVAENRRCAMLRFLADDTDYTINDSLLDSALAAIGHAVSRDLLRTEIAWLEEQGLVTVRKEMDGRVLVITLTGRGLDVAQGRTVVPGVQRPRPSV
jgi:hypothetical protein